MARTRINRRVAIGMAAFVGLFGAAAGGAVYWKYSQNKDPAKFIAAGEMYEKAGDTQQAISAYNMVARLRPTDPDVHLRLGRLYYKQRGQDFVTNVRAAVAEWTRAEELKQDSVEAWRGLLEANMLAAVASGQGKGDGMHENDYQLPRQFAIARDAAQHLVKLDPKDPTGRSAIPILTINLWMLNLPIPQPQNGEGKGPAPTEAQQVDSAITDLTACMRDHPEDSDLPYWIARAKITQAIRLTNQNSSDALNGLKRQRDRSDLTDAGDATDGNPAGGRGAGGGTGGGLRTDGMAADRVTDVRALFGEAATVFDEPISRQPNNAQLYFKKYDVLTTLISVDPTPNNIAAYQKSQREALEAAQAHVTAAEPSTYVNYKIAWGDYLAVRDPGRAEAVYKDLLDHLPAARGAAAGAAGAGAAQPTDAEHLQNEITVRIQFARLLERDPTRRQAALAVLDPLPRVAPQDLSSVDQPAVAFRLALVRLLRGNILTDLLETNQNPTVQADLAKRATDEIDGAAANASLANEYDVLKARGRLELVSEKFRPAIQTLSTALDRLKSSGRGTDYQLIGWLATAYARGQQTGQAIKLLEQAVRNPSGQNNRQPHMMLAQMYLQEQDYDKARQQVAWVAERYPDDLSTIQLQLYCLGRNPDPKLVAPLYDRLPERSAFELLQKKDWAVQTKNTPEVERLLGKVLELAPGEPSVSIALAQTLAADGKLGQANNVLDAAIARRPEKKQAISIIKDTINGANMAAVGSSAHQVAVDIKDPLTRETALWHLAQGNGDVAEQIAHLEAARRIAPENRDVLNNLFLTYLSAKAFDKAQAMLADLAKYDIDDAKGNMFRVRLALARGDKQDALNLARGLVTEFPQFAGSYQFLGEAQEATGQRDQLEAACQQFLIALDHQGNNPQAMTHLVECSIKLGRLDDARRYLADARRKFPDDPTYRSQQVRVELTYGDPELVLGIVDDSVKDHPDQPQAWQTAVQVYAAAGQRRGSRGDADGAAGFNDKVRQLLTAAIGRFPEQIVFASELADLQCQDKSDAGVAAAAATLAKVGQTPAWHENPLPDVMLGRMYLSVGRPQQAEGPLRRALSRAKDNPDALTLLADDLVAQKKPQEALDTLAPAKDQPTIRAKYVDLMLGLNRAPEVEAELLAELKARPDAPQAGNLLAHVYAAQGKFDTALDVANRTLAANPKDLAAYYVRGTTLAERPHPDLDGAARDLAVYRQAFPNNVQGRTALAAVLMAKRDVEGAAKELEAAVAIAPDDKSARLRLIQAYLAVQPPRVLDAKRIVAQTQAMPSLAHDPDVQRVAALVWIRGGDAGDKDRAVTSIRDAMAHVADQRTMLDAYFDVLMATQNYALLLAESDKFVNAPGGAAWSVYDFRGRARAATNDLSGAEADFATALDQAGTDPRGAGPALAVAGHVTDLLGVDKAVQMVLPRAQNSAFWKFVLANCYQRAKNVPQAIVAAEGAMAAAGDFQPADRRTLVKLTATLYMTASPPRGDKALPLLQSVLKETPDDVDALNNVACTLTDLVSPPRYKEALEASTRAYDEVRKAGVVNPFIFDTQGWLLILNGRLDDGIDLLHGIAASADFPDAHYHLAQGYIRKGGELENAKAELNAATDLINRMEAAHQPFDQSMKSKVQAAQQDVEDRITKSLAGK